MNIVYGILILAALVGAGYVGKRLIAWRKSLKSTLQKSVDQL